MANNSNKPVAVVVGADEPFGAEIVERLTGDGFSVVKIDGSADELVAALARETTPIAALVLNRPFEAGTKPFLEITDSEFDAAIERGLVEPLLAIQVAVPRMPSGSAIVEVSSRAHLGAWHSSHVAATGGAVATMGRCLAIELRSSGLRVNVVAPEFVSEVRQAADGPQSVASAVAFFAGANSAPASGLTYMVNGVASMQLNEMARR